MNFETNLCYVLLSLWGHLHPHDGMPSLPKATLQWVLRQDIQWAFLIPYHQWKSSIFECWSGHKIDSKKKRSLTFSHFLLVLSKQFGHLNVAYPQRGIGCFLVNDQDERGWEFIDLTLKIPGHDVSFSFSFSQRLPQASLLGTPSRWQPT